MKYKAARNFINGEGEYKKGEEYNGQEAEALLAQGLIEIDAPAKAIEPEEESDLSASSEEEHEEKKAKKKKH